MNTQLEIELKQVSPDTIREIEQELQRAKAKFPFYFNSSHEGFAVLQEEVDELWDDVKANRKEAARKEAIQVAAMAIRFIQEL